MQPSRYKQSGIVPVIGKLFKGNRSADQRRDLEVGFLRPDVARRPWLTSFGLAVSAKLEVKACVAEPKGAGRDGGLRWCQGQRQPFGNAQVEGGVSFESSAKHSQAHPSALPIRLRSRLLFLLSRNHAAITGCPYRQALPQSAISISLTEIEVVGVEACEVVAGNKGRWLESCVDDFCGPTFY